MATAQEVINNLAKISKARFIAKDVDGTWCVYVGKPFYDNSDMWYIESDCRYIELDKNIFDIEDVYWKDSLFEAQD